MTRNEHILQLRSAIITDETKTSLAEERFQNNTLRPVLKLQNELILALVNKHLTKNELSQNNAERKKAIELCLAEQVIKQQLIGLTIGLFTTEEFDYYLQNQSTINKRINQLIAKRVCDNMIVWSR